MAEFEDYNYLFLNLREVSPTKGEIVRVAELLRQIHAEDFGKLGNVEIEILDYPRGDNYQEVEYHLRIYFETELGPDHLEIYYKLIGTCLGCVRTLRSVANWLTTL